VNRPILLLGPTAGGKSELAVELASLLPGGEVISADSMQVYRHMDAGTAKPAMHLQQRVPHHLIDIVEPAQRFTVHDWLSRATPLIDNITASGGTPIVVGGTNLYMKALLHGLFDGPGVDEAFRASLEPIDAPLLHERLQQVDPPAAQRIDPNDRKRITRALEVHHLIGQPISSLQTQWDPIRHPPSAIRHFRLLGLHWPTDEINKRINLRVKRMFFPAPGSSGFAQESLPDETRRLETAGLLGPPGSQAREALGYKQVLAAFRGEMTMDEAFERTKILTRRFAKQQRTWLRRFPDVHWIDAMALPLHVQVDAALNALR